MERDAQARRPAIHRAWKGLEDFAAKLQGPRPRRRTRAAVAAAVEGLMPRWWTRHGKKPARCYGDIEVIFNQAQPNSKANFIDFVQRHAPSVAGRSEETS